MASDSRFNPTPIAAAKGAVLVETAGQGVRRIYADWMVSTLREFHQAPKGERPLLFDFLGKPVCLESSMFDVLGTAYERYVPEETRPLFRDAIGDALSSIASEPHLPESVMAFDDLIHLVGEIKPTEALTPMVAAVGDGEIGRRAKRLLKDTIRALAMFSSPDENDIVTRVIAFQATNRLLNSPNFDNDFIFAVTEVMVSCDPQFAIDTVRKYADRFVQSREKYGSAGGRLQARYERALKHWINNLTAANPSVLTPEVLSIVRG